MKTRGLVIGECPYCHWDFSRPIMEGNTLHDVVVKTHLCGNRGGREVWLVLEQNATVPYTPYTLSEVRQTKPRIKHVLIGLYGAHEAHWQIVAEEVEP